MSDFGALLYETKTDSNKNSYAFIVVGIALMVGSNFIYAKTMLMIFGVVMILIGLYVLLFNRSKKISIFEHAIILTVKGQEIVIDKEDIVTIEYEEMQVRRSPVVSYYPKLILKDQSQVLINKAFNSVINKDFEKVIKSYIG